MQIVSVGIDLGKTTFHLVALGAAGKVLVRKKFTQRQLLTYTANMQTSLIGLEACSGAHFLGRALRKQGHDVRLIAAQFVKPFVKVQQERLRGCRGDRRSGGTQEHALRPDQDR
jgi:transposase